MPAPGARTLALAGLLAVLAVPGAGAQSGGTPPSAGGSGPRQGNEANVCRADRTPRLRCPDLILRTPYDRYFERVGTRIRYHAGNSIVNRGQGPAELFGHRTAATGPMAVIQHIYGFDGRRYSFRSPRARIIFKFIPRLGPYWKFENAARFELWSVDPQGRLLRLVRTGPKFVYCLRDLSKRLFLPFSPAFRHYPACNQDPRRRFVTLGTSVGWADEYPASYYEQWIDVTGLRGRFAFVQRVDPLNGIRESNEANNVSPSIFLRLPPGTRTSSRGRSEY